jgi:glycerol uptake facilitator-like aquaporin
VVLIAVLGPLSGGHFNPVVSGVIARCGDLRSSDIAPCILAQGAGGAVGAVLANLMSDLAPVQIATTLRGGSG